MNLEERIVNELRAERDAVPTARSGPVPAMGAVWPRRLAQMTATLLVVSIGLALFLGGGSSDRVAAEAVGRGKLLMDGDVVLPVERAWGPVEARPGTFTVLVGASAPAPTTDLDIEGQEQPLVRASPDWDPAVWVGDVPFVYVGDVNGRSVFVHTNGTISAFDHLAAAVQGDTIGDHICLTVGSYDAPNGGMGLCGGGTSWGGPFIRNEVGTLDTGWASWVDVPAGTSVVAASIDGSGVLWQRPVGETAFFDFGAIPDGMVTLTALSVQGEVLATEQIPREFFLR